MEVSIIGLGKMGGNMARRLRRAGHRVVGYDLNADNSRELEDEIGLVPAFSMEELVATLEEPKTVWVMVPAGGPVESVIDELAEMLSEGDIIVDGGNSNYKDTLRRAAMLAERDIHFVDVGTSGGIWGLQEGYSMMVGGADAAVAHVRPALEALAPAPDQGWGHVGPTGAGHFTKMVHNGIEYGLMEAYAEGFEILRTKEPFDLDLHQIACIWQYGSVIRSWLLDLAAGIFAKDQDLAGIASWVDDSGEGRWTVFEAIDLDVPAPVITLALQMRLVSRQDESYAHKLLAALRNEFGGHEVKKKGVGNRE